MDNHITPDNGILIGHFVRDPLTHSLVLFTERDFQQICLRSRNNHPAEELSPSANHQEWCRFCTDPNHLHDHLIRKMIRRWDIGGEPIISIAKKNPDVIIEGKVIHQGDGDYDLITNIGVEESIGIGSNHSLRMTQLSTSLLAASLDKCYERICDLNGDQRLNNIIMWSEVNNRVQDLGYVHPHWHINGHTGSFPRIRDEMPRCYFQYYYIKPERCLMCDQVANEKALKNLVVCETEHFLVFEPRGARHSLETWVVPKAHFPTFETLCAAHPSVPSITLELAGIFQDLLLKFEIICGARCPVELLLFNAPRKYLFGFPLISRPYLSREEIELCFHARFRLIPLIVQRSMHSNATGIAYNPLIPSEAARLLRMSREDLSAWINQN